MGPCGHGVVSGDAGLGRRHLHFSISDPDPVSFWFEDRVGIVPPVFNMLSFGRYPLTIYNNFIQFMLSWIVPFPFASFYPTTRFLGREEFATHFRAGPLVASFFLLLDLVFWNRGVRNYISTGS